MKAQVLVMNTQCGEQNPVHVFIFLRSLLRLLTSGVQRPQRQGKSKRKKELGDSDSTSPQGRLRRPREAHPPAASPKVESETPGILLKTG
jgi:hypothetical protein